MSKSLNIVIAGGGTGGHIFPALAIAHALKKLNPHIQFLFIGAKGKMEMEKVPAAGFNIKGLDIAGFNRSSLLKNIGLPFKIIKSFLQVRQIFSEFRPDAVIGVGGYSSYPVLRYAQQKGIKTFIHESNSFAGKANIQLGKNATKIFVASAGMEKFFPANKIIITGNPVREGIGSSAVSKESALASFGLNTGKLTVLAVGGSLGAQSINEALCMHLNAFEKNNLQLIWQTGKGNMTEPAKAAAGYNNVWVGEFIQDIDRAYAAADIVISRSGAMAVTELCLVGKPVIFVPFPFAAEDHQTVNAKVLVNKQAALLVKNDVVKSDLVEKVIDLAKDSGLQRTLATNIKAMGIADADKKIAEEILNVINNHA